MSVRSLNHLWSYQNQVFLCLFSLQNSLAFTPAGVIVAFSFCKTHYRKQITLYHTEMYGLFRKKRKVIVILCRAESSGVCWFSLFLYSRKHEIFCFSFSFWKFSGTWKALHWEFVWETFIRMHFFVLKWEWGKRTHYNKPTESTVHCFKSSEGLDMYQNNLSWLNRLSFQLDSVQSRCYD